MPKDGDARGSYPALFSPLDRGRLKLKNRLVMTAHLKSFSEDGKPTARDAAYMDARAAGGVAMIISEANAVHRSSWYSGMNRAYDPDVIRPYSAVVDAIHAHDAISIAQLNHCGSQGPVANGPLWGASGMRGWGVQEPSHAMTENQIDEVVESYVQSAMNMRAAGHDGVEIHSGHGYLLHEFLSPLMNKRDDQYGGTDANRRRLAERVLTEVRAAVGADLIVGVRISAEDRLPAGLSVDDMITTARAYEGLGVVDYVNVTNGTHESYEHMMPNSYTPPGVGANYGIAFAPHLAVPVIGVGKVHDPALAESLVSSGRLELVGMARPLIAEPNLPVMIRAGREGDVRPCIAVNHCLKSISRGSLKCAVNPRVGLEAEAQPTVSSRSIAVIGAGPAGLEVAAVAAEQGIAVTLFEARDHVGGELWEASRFPGQQAKQRLIEYYENRLASAGVTLILGTRIDEKDEHRLAHFDDVIVATGGRRLAEIGNDRSQPIGNNSPHGLLFTGALTELIDMPLHNMHVVLVAWEADDAVALQLIHDFSRRVRRLTVISSFDDLGAGFDPATKDGLNRLLLSEAVRLLTRTTVQEVDADSLLLLEETRSRSTRLPQVDLVVSTGRRISNSFTTGRLGAQHHIGDCAAPRGLAAAIAEGHRAATDLLRTWSE